MARRATRPLNSEACRAADEDLYARHEGDPRPNALYDADGNRQLLDPYDPDQADLRSEWMDLYEAHGGEVETTGTPSREVDSPEEPCPLQTGILVVTVTDSTDGSDVEGVDVQVAGPQTRNGVTDPEGHAEFTGLDPGAYTIAAVKAGYVDGSGAGTVAAETTTSAEVTIRRRRITSVTINRSPKKIVHPYNESITFTAAVQPTPEPAGLTYQWTVDGVVDASSTARTFTKQFTPAATVAERRKDYTVAVSVEGLSDDTTVRVGQNANVGTANPTQDNAGMDTYGYTDTNPVQFDTGLTAAEDTSLQTSNGLARQVRSQALPDGTTQYGRLQFATAGAGDAACTGWTKRHAALIYTKSSAFNWNKEELDEMLDHEVRHAEHRAASTTATNIWALLWDQGFASHFSPFTETYGYREYVQSTTVSYKWLLDYDAIGSFVREYNLAKTALGTLAGATQTSARALLQTAYDTAQYPELREATAEGWDHHIDAP